jgi:hypothetical protein
LFPGETCFSLFFSKKSLRSAPLCGSFFAFIGGARTSSLFISARRGISMGSGLLS